MGRFLIDHPPRIRHPDDLCHLKSAIYPLESITYGVFCRTLTNQWLGRVRRRRPPSRPERRGTVDGRPAPIREADGQGTARVAMPEDSSTIFDRPRFRLETEGPWTDGLHRSAKPTVREPQGSPCPRIRRPSLTDRASAWKPSASAASSITGVLSISRLRSILDFGRPQGVGVADGTVETQRARVLAAVKTRRCALPLLRGVEGLDGRSAHAHPDWFLHDGASVPAPTCCGRRTVQIPSVPGAR